jgi:hypothetical protein
MKWSDGRNLVEGAGLYRKRGKAERKSELGVVGGFGILS